MQTNKKMKAVKRIALSSLMIMFIMGLSTQITSAQRIAYVDIQYILDKMPEYTEAQTKIDVISKKWQGEIETMYTEIEKMYRDYQTEQVFLTEEMKRKKEEEILNKEKAVKVFQKSKFGYEGELFKKRQELVKPIQDKVYDVISKYAVDRRYDIILDKSSGMTLLYTNPSYDKSDDIIRALGLTGQ